VKHEIKAPTRYLRSERAANRRPNGNFRFAPPRSILEWRADFLRSRLYQLLSNKRLISRLINKQVMMTTTTILTRPLLRSIGNHQARNSRVVSRAVVLQPGKNERLFGTLRETRGSRRNRDVILKKITRARGKDSAVHSRAHRRASRQPRAVTQGTLDLPPRAFRFDLDQALISSRGNLHGRVTALSGYSLSRR